MDSTTYEFDQMHQFIRCDCQFDVRLALQAETDAWRVDHLVAVCVDSDRQSVPEFHYDYGNSAFMRGLVTGHDLLAWVGNRMGTLHGVSFELAELASQVNLQHVPSKYRWGLQCLDTPSFQHTLRRQNSSQSGTDHGMLLGEGMPLLPSYDEAVVELLYGFTPDRNRNARPSDYIHIIVPDFTARFSGVRIYPYSMQINVGGERAEGLSLHIAGVDPTVHVEMRVDKVGTYTVPLNHGVPSRMLCVLGSNRNWIDVRHIDSSFTNNSGPNDVVYATHEGSASDSVSALIARGEGPTVDFKEDRPKHDDKWLKTVVAFANGQGGTIIFGVNDEGVAVGVPGDSRAFCESITNSLQGRVEPAVHVAVNEIPLAQQILVVVMVPEGDRKPYALATQNTYRYYYRMGSTTFEARPEDLRLILARAQDEQHSGVTSWLGRLPFGPLA